MIALFYGVLLVLGVVLLVVTAVRVLAGGLEAGSGRPGRPSGTEEYQHRSRVLGEGKS